MASDLVALCFGANDVDRLARFWGGVLGWEIADEPQGGVALVPSDGTGFRLRLLPTQEPKVMRNRIHLDLTSTSLAGQQETVARAIRLGGRHLDIGQGPDEGQVVLADPDGNELCVIEPGNSFLADCGVIGAINCDGTQQAGYFWSEALGWPLVWDQDEETAVQSPRGGTKIAWGGPPVMPKPARNRLHFDLLPADDAGPRAEVDRLVSLGATRLDVGQDDPDRVWMADPDGNEFSVLTSRPPLLTDRR